MTLLGPIPCDAPPIAFENWYLALFWTLDFGISRELGAWDLELPALLGQIILLRILPHHPRRSILRHQRHHRPPNPLYPLSRNALRIAFEEQRNHLLRQHLEKICAIDAV